MANLLEIAELAWRQLFPNPGDEAALTREEFVATAKSEFSYQMLLMIWREKRDEGYYEVPGYLSKEVSLPVVNDRMDISQLEIHKSIPQEVWLQNIGGLTCNCKYVKTTLNLSQLLCDDDSMGDDVRTYLVLGREIRFPQGAHTSPLSIIYADKGEGVDGSIEVDDAIGGIVRRMLIEIYGGKTGQEDETENENATT